jgi:hypothetical protein
MSQAPWVAQRTTGIPWLRLFLYMPDKLKPIICGTHQLKLLIIKGWRESLLNKWEGEELLHLLWLSSA